MATALLQMLLLVGFGIVVMRANWGHASLAMALMLLSAALAGAALGTALGALVRTESQTGGVSVLAGMVMALLGGCRYPLELFPRAMQSAARIFPTTWAMQGLLQIVLCGRGLTSVLPMAGVLLGYAGAFFAIGIWRFHYE